MNRLPSRPLLASLLLLAGAACAALLSAPAQAAPAVTLSWDLAASGAQQVVTKKFTGPGPYDIYVAVTGQSVPVLAYELVLDIHGGRGLSETCGFVPVPPIPPAWRFDAGSCAQGRLCYDGGELVGTDPAAKAARQIIADVSYDPVSDFERVTFAEADPTPLQTPDPARTYRLLHLHLDQTTDCAGEMDTVSVALDLAHWIDITQTPEFEWPMYPTNMLGWNADPLPGICDVKGPIEPSLLTGLITPVSAMRSGSPVTQSGFSQCDAVVPARPVSWGLVKSVYR